MPVWEYKLISSGKGGFATPALMESFLNQLGKDEWEIIHFQTPPDNPFAFTGLARRTTQRDWTLEDAAAAAARAEADKLRAEFEAKFKGAGAGGSAGGAAEEQAESAATQKLESEEGFRKIRNTESDQDAGAEDEPEADEWDQLGKEEELPTFFEAIQPLMRRNQRGAGMSVGVDHLAKKWQLAEDDVFGALKECGFVIPDDEDEKPVYVEYDGDLFWVNVNRRGEYWVNTKEKPRQVFRIVKGERPAAEEAPPTPPEGAMEPTEGEATAASADADRSAEGGAAADKGERREERRGRDRDRDRGRGNDRGERGDRGDRGGDQGGKRGLPEGQALLERIRPLMRRARGGSGGSGSTGFLSRALKCRENELIAAFQGLGLTVPEAHGSPQVEIAIGDALWWLNKDNRGGVWINDRKPDGEGSPAEGASSAEGAPVPVAAELPPAVEPPAIVVGGPNDPGMTSEAPVVPEPEADEADGDDDEKDEGIAAGVLPAPIDAVRSQLKPTRSGALAGEICALAEAAGQPVEDFFGSLKALGLHAPEKAREKTDAVEFGAYAVSLTRNAKDEVWLNVKTPGSEKKPRRPRRGSSSE